MDKYTANLENQFTANLEEDPETGELVLPLPDDLLTKLGWQIGDVLDWSKGEGGSWIISKKKEKEVTRFDLEQDIMRTWHIIEDLDIFCEEVGEKDMSTDDLMNRLIGLSSVYNARFEKLFNTFEKLIKNGNL